MKLIVFVEEGARSGIHRILSATVPLLQQSAEIYLPAWIMQIHELCEGLPVDPVFAFNI